MRVKEGSRHETFCWRGTNVLTCYDLPRNVTHSVNNSSGKSLTTDQSKDPAKPLAKGWRLGRMTHNLRRLHVEETLVRLCKGDGGNIVWRNPLCFKYVDGGGGRGGNGVGSLARILQS